MSKKNFEGGAGLDGLFSKTKRAAATIDAEPKPKEPQEQAQLTGRGDILSTIQDAELRAALRAKRMDGRGRPRNGAHGKSKADGYIRATILVDAEKYDRLRQAGAAQGLIIKETMEAAIDLALAAYDERGSFFSREKE